MKLLVVPGDLVPQLLELWDQSAHEPANRQNQPFTHGARLKWTARKFIAAHPGHMWGQAKVRNDLCHVLWQAQLMAERLQGKSS